MVRYIKIFSLALFLLGLTNVSFGQKKQLVKAEMAYNTGRFFDAIDLYKYAYGKVEDKEKKIEITYKVAMCYKFIGYSKQAALWFNKAIKKGYKGPLAYLYYADALRSEGEYDNAKKYYEKYQNLVPDDKYVKKAIKSCVISKKWIDKPTRYKIVPMYFFDTKSSEFCPCYGKDNYSIVYFTTSAKGTAGGKINPVTGQNYTDIYYSRVDRKGEWSKPRALGKNVNTEFDEGVSCTNLKANRLYFTAIRKNKDGDMVTQIYLSKKKGLEWGEAEPVKLFESDTILAAHPAISADELTLYFVSNKDGGLGGKDIWVAKRKSVTSDWETPTNLGAPINTAGDEVFPYVHKDGTLYFSSNGHVGMGGLDLFAAKKEGSKWKVYNLKYPMNSSKDDFGIVFERKLERGYFSSNRKGRKGQDDIYQFSLPPLKFVVNLVVKNEKTTEIIADAKVNLIGSDGTNETKTTESDGTVSLNLNPNTDYRIITRKGGFLAGKSKVSTKGITENKEIPLVVYMAPNDAPKLVKVYYDFGKWDLKPESMTALEELVEILRDDNPNITIELSSHTDYRGSSESNKILSQKRAQSVVDFLVLYGIDADRLTAVGYGETRPKKITAKEALEFSKRPGWEFLRRGTVLSEKYIKSLPTEQMKEIANSLNRRTEFRVTGTDYVPRIRHKK